MKNKPNHSRNSNEVANLTIKLFESNLQSDHPLEITEESVGVVELHDSGVPFLADAGLAWQEITKMLQLTLPKIEAYPNTSSLIQITSPKEWQRLVYRQPPILFLPMAFGNYPQRVRELTKLISSTSFSTQNEIQESIPCSSGLKEWVKEQLKKEDFPISLMTIGVVRSSGDFDYALELLKEISSNIRPELESLYQNELASTYWHQGKHDLAISIWRGLPKSIAVSFNLGLANLAGKNYSEAVLAFEEVIKNLEDNSSWKHLAAMYRAISKKYL